MRKPSPIQEKASLVYRGTCQDYLDARKELLPESRKKEMLSEIRQYEIEVSDSGWYRGGKLQRNCLMIDDLSAARRKIALKSNVNKKKGKDLPKDKCKRFISLSS